MKAVKNPKNPNNVPAAARGNVPPLSQLLAHLQAGLTPADVARMSGCSSSAIYAAMSRHGIDITALRTFKERKADVITHVQRLVVEAMPGKVEDTSLRDLATTFNILHNAERLERGQSTANLSVSALMEQIGGADEAIARLEEQLKLAKTDATDVTPVKSDA
jgi:hypothetical protein